MNKIWLTECGNMTMSNCKQVATQEVAPYVLIVSLLIIFGFVIYYKIKGDVNDEL